MSGLGHVVEKAAVPQSVATFNPLNPYDAPWKRTYVRSHDAEPRWGYMASPQVNPTNTFKQQTSSDPAEQQIRPFNGPTIDGRLFNSEDFNHRRILVGKPGESNQLMLNAMVGYEVALQKWGPNHNLTRYKKQVLETFHNKSRAIADVHRWNGVVGQ